MSSKLLDLELTIALIILHASFILATGFELPSTAHVPTTWVNNDQNFPVRFKYFRPMLLSTQENVTTEKKPRYLCGFYCAHVRSPFISHSSDDTSSQLCDRYVFSVVIAYESEKGQIGDFQEVWTANRDHPVRLKATLQLTLQGGLILKDVDGTVAWSTNITIEKSSAGLSLYMTEWGSLVLFDDKVVWESFDDPTDTLVLLQPLKTGQKLTTTPSHYDSQGNMNTTKFQCFLSDTWSDLLFYIESNPPQLLARQPTWRWGLLDGGTLARGIYKSLSLPNKSWFLFLQLRWDGHLILYEHPSNISSEDLGGWKQIADVLDTGGCHNPMACGKYGICMGDKQCSCPISSDQLTSYFQPINGHQLDQGCAPITPLTCNASKLHTFVTLEGVSYYGDIKSGTVGDIQINRCKELCLRNCSCKAAITVYLPASNNVSCHLLSDVFSMEKGNSTIDVSKHQASAFIKVQNTSNPFTPTTGKGNHNRMLMIGISIGGLFIVIVFIGGALFKIRKKGSDAGDADDNLEHVLGMLSRFSYDELKVATADFTTKLGQGGFGSVFEGVLKDGEKVAVKRLDGVGQITKSFLAEVESIGNIHHVNLVRLIGFCAEKSHKLLVYEYMINGSLDRWIYGNSHNVILDWNSRRKIIQDVAKGLAYLHHDCRKKIVHLDVKPQNILLDEHLNAKLSDFGLAKLIDRGQSKMVMTMRGTPGYLAPEWLSGVVTEKVDVYSFGIVFLEILCGRKHFEVARHEESQHLLSLFKVKAEDGKLVDLVDNRSEDMLSHSDEVVEMMKLAGWCLVTESNRRPSMSMVSKLLEGVFDNEGVFDYNLLNTTLDKNERQIRDSTQLLPSILSGPR